MAKIFKKFRRKKKIDSREAQSKKKEDLMDPVLYQGGLDKEKYPVLPTSDDKVKEIEVENPLNKR